MSSKIAGGAKKKTYILLKKRADKTFQIITDVKSKTFRAAAAKAVNRMGGNKERKERKRVVWVMLKLGAGKGVKIGKYRVWSKPTRKNVKRDGEAIQYRFAPQVESLQKPTIVMGIHQHDNTEMIRAMNKML
jgi:hypothetical protein